jgi:hypothetical protein
LDGAPCPELFHSAANGPADDIRDWSASQTWEVLESELYDIVPNVVRRTPQSTQAPPEAKPCVSPDSFKTTPETTFCAHAPEFTPATVEEYGGETEILEAATLHRATASALVPDAGDVQIASVWSRPSTTPNRPTVYIHPCLQCRNKIAEGISIGFCKACEKLRAGGPFQS